MVVRWSLEEIAGKVRLKEPKTRAGRRRILIAPRTLLPRRCHRKRIKAAGRDTDKGVVFCAPEGGFLRISDVRRHSFLPTLKRADLPAIRL